MESNDPHVPPEIVILNEVRNLLWLLGETKKEPDSIFIESGWRRRV